MSKRPWTMSKKTEDNVEKTEDNVEKTEDNVEKTLVITHYVERVKNNSLNEIENTWCEIWI